MATKVKYVWRGGENVGTWSTAQYVGERLAAIERKKGVLEPPDVVDDARSPASPLHRYFEWDDGVAAEKYRLVQARHLIAHICVRSIDSAPIRPTRAFVNIRSDHLEPRAYESIHIVLSDKAKRARLLAQAKAELAEWKKRYEDLEEFALVFDAITKVDA